MATEGSGRPGTAGEPTADVEGPWSHDQAVVGDVRLHYVEAGDEDDPLVVLLHGFPEFWYSWRHQLPALADAGFRAVAPDMRGYNRSEKPRGLDSYRTDELVGDVAGLIEHFGRERAHVVGHDWGGLVAWQTAMRRPDAVDRLAVLNAPHPAAYRRELKRNPEQWRRSWYVGWFQVPALPETFLGARNAAGVGRLLRESADPDTFSDAEVRRYRAAASRPGALSSALNYYRALFRESLGDELRRAVGRRERRDRVRAPTRLIWGERDPALAVELTEGLDRWVPDLRVERLPAATHWVQNDRPDAVSDLLVDHFEE
ncbi:MULTISPECIES: alpha/beta fold hydrolase [Halorussus]|uniref:alpha/beta fold hydrolase n=1 Tax=Halorussus TaxID=1070314 RepID=UPI000E20CB39|nr:MULTISPECIES: alpha/beta hydrolase [Halorussus]NHN58420.1 alpha/beta hydrolase [Halorussus sp. JP-T4]